MYICSTLNSLVFCTTAYLIFAEYWTEIAGMKVFEQTRTEALLGYTKEQAKLQLHAIDGKVDHQKAFGRIAIACPRDQVILCF